MGCRYTRHYQYAFPVRYLIEHGGYEQHKQYLYKLTGKKLELTYVNGKNRSVVGFAEGKNCCQQRKTYDSEYPAPVSDLSDIL